MKRTLVLTGIALVVVFGLVGIAYAGTQVGSVGDKLSDNGTVTITATAKPKLTLTLSTSAIDFGDVNPEQDYSDTVDVTVRSNKLYNITREAATGDVALMGLSVSGGANATGEARGENTYTETFDINVPITTPADQALSASQQYTVTQQ